MMEGEKLQASHQAQTGFPADRVLQKSAKEYPSLELFQGVLPDAGRGPSIPLKGDKGEEHELQIEN